MNKKFLCLANSRKTSGRCVAGKLIEDNELKSWFRPISDRNSGELSDSDIRYENGEMAQALDVIQLELKGKASHPTQEENYFIDDQYYWFKASQFDSDLIDLLDEPDSLWDCGNSSYSGYNDRVSLSSIPDSIQSLYLIKPEELTIIVRVEGEEFNNAKRKVRAQFSYRNNNYLLSVTDPLVESLFLKKNDGSYTYKEPRLLTLSLGDSYQDQCYKLVACILKEKK